MVDLEAVRVLCAVERARSLSAAARSVGMSKSTAWRKLAQLEEQMGCLLLERSQRHQRLTPAGRELVARGRNILAEVEETRVAVKSTAAGERGVLRVGTPPGLSPEMLIEALKYASRHDADVSCHLFESAMPLHPLRDDFDLVLTFSRPTDGDLYMYKLDPLRWGCVASPEYLAARGVPETLADLSKHDLLCYYLPPRSPVHLPLRGGGEVQVRPLLAATSLAAIAQAVKAGVGIGYLPFTILSEIEGCVEVLPELIGEDGFAYLVAGQRGRDSARVRLAHEISQYLWEKRQRGTTGGAAGPGDGPGP